MSTYCGQCGAAEADGRKFCTHCGAALTPPVNEPGRPGDARARARAARAAPVAPIPPARTATAQSNAGQSPPEAVRAAGIGAAGAGAAFAVAAVANALMSTGVEAEGYSPIKAAAADVVVAFGGVISYGGEGGLRMPRLSLLVLALVVTALLARRDFVRDWMQAPRQRWGVMAGLAGGALAAMLLLSAISSALDTSASLAGAVLVAPLAVLVAGAKSLGGPWRGRLEPFLSWTLPVAKVLGGAAAVLGVVWAGWVTAFAAAEAVADEGVTVANVVGNFLSGLLDTGTFVAWSGLALMGVPVRTGAAATADPDASINTISVLSNNIPMPAVLVLAAAIVALGAVTAASILRSA